MKQNTTDNITEASSAVATKHPYRVRFIALITALTLLVLGAATLILFTFVDFSDKDGGATGSNQNAGYPYRETVITDYISLTKDMVTGLVVPGADSKLNAVTDESIKTSINQKLLAAVKTKGQYTVTKTTKIGYADELRLHVLYVTNAAGDHVGEDYFPSAYMTSNFFQVGMEFFGKDFDDKLIELELAPENVGIYEVRTHGSIDEDDVICLTYTVTEKIPAATEDGEETTKTYVTMTSERIDLARKDEKWRKLLLDNYGTVGQSFSFDHEEDIDDDGDEEKVTYTCVVASVLTKEEPFAVTAELPEDFFAEGYADEELVALNGTELTYYINIEFLIDHEANTWETMTLADMTTTLGFTPTDKSNLEAARTECIDYYKKNTDSSYEQTLEQISASLIWNYLLDTIEFSGELPEKALEEMKETLRLTIENEYANNSAQYSNFTAIYPNIEFYAQDTWGYDAKDYESYEDYIDSYLASRSVKQQLLTFGIYKTFLNDKKVFDAKYEELIAEIIDASTTSEGIPTRKEVIEYYEKYYGKHYLSDTVKSELVNEYLIKNNSIDWNTYKDSK